MNRAGAFTASLAAALLFQASCSGSDGSGTEDASHDTAADSRDPSVDISYTDCPERGDFVMSLRMINCTEAATTTFTGRVERVAEDPPGALVVAVWSDEGTPAAELRIFTTALPTGADVDLHADDIVEVTYWHLPTCLGCDAETLTITREGELVLHARACRNELCHEASFTAGPFEVSILTDRCPPYGDGLLGTDGDCRILERFSLEFGCASAEDVEIFGGQEAVLTCGADYHVAAGYLERVREDSGYCFDLPDQIREIVILRHGTGVSG